MLIKIVLCPFSVIIVPQTIIYNDEGGCVLKRYIFLIPTMLLLINSSLTSGTDSNHTNEPQSIKELTLTPELAVNFASLALSCIEKEFPNPGVASTRRGHVTDDYRP